MYYLIRKFLFLFDAEAVHYFAMNALRFLCRFGFIKKIIASRFTPARRSFSEGGPANSRLTTHVSRFGLAFKNPVGLGAGFDKNALYLAELETLGFGFVEIGTVTPLPQEGNEKPRLFRLPKDKALINRMGFNNHGVKEITKRLKDWKQFTVRSSQFTASSQQSTQTTHHSPLTTHHSRLIIGGNIGKNKVTPNEEAWKDYETCFKALFDWVDYFVVNVSSPNTPGLRELQEKDALRKILSHLQIINRQQVAAGAPMQKPLLLKIAPDLTKEQVDDVIDLAMEIKLDGLVCANTTISRERLTTDASRLTSIGAGGLSGLPLKERSTELVRYIHEKTNGQLPVIASGGIFTGADAKEKLVAGASLVQVWTGFIYEGPGIVKNICREL